MPLHRRVRPTAPRLAATRRATPAFRAWPSALLALLLWALPRAASAAPSVTVTVNPSSITNPQARNLLGTSFDGRTGVQLFGPGGSVTPTGYFDINNQILPGIAPLWSQLHLTTLRYPGNAVDQFDWRETVGPVAERSPQPYAGNSIQTQVIHFGFDDFMAMVAAHNPPGEPAPDVQIMVSTDTSLALPTQADLIQMAADWVEYANAPADSSNPGGGIDWAAERAKNGHPAPYGIRIWNVGNEPWGPTQAFNFNVQGNAAAFAALAQQYITAMKAIDPTILITLPTPAHPLLGTVDNVPQATWDNAMLSQLGGQIFGLSEHIFYDETAVRGVAASAGSIDAVLSRIAASAHPGVRLLLGDHARLIPSNPTPAQIDYGMQWQAALTSADFLLMLAGKPVERANFWIFGHPQSTWHPIRRNANGTYTLMPAGALYARLGGLLHDQALATTTVSPPSLDGTASYSVRAGAFRTADGSGLSIVVANRDTISGHTVALQGLTGWDLASASLLSASGPAADAFVESAVPLPAPADGLALPAASILLLELTPAVTAVQTPPRQAGAGLGIARPNPASQGVTFTLSGPGARARQVTVYDVAGHAIRQLKAGGDASALEWDLRDGRGVRVPPGVYLVSTLNGSARSVQRIAVTK